MKITKLVFLTSSAITLLSLAHADEMSEFRQFSSQQEDALQNELNEFETYKKALEAGFAEYEKAYQDEFYAYKQEILTQWGEFKDTSPTVWVSYDEAGKVRRTVDYKTGGVQVELLINKGDYTDQTKSELDKAVYRLMNTTEKEAFKKDVVASRVEEKISKFGALLQKGDLTDERLFAIEDFVALNMNHSGYMNVSTKTVANTDLRNAVKDDKEIVRVLFKIPHSIHKKAIRYSEAVSAAAEKEKISDELIYAIMETESSFNPMAKSHIPAYGLMQIVPRSAGKDATKYLFGKAKMLAPSYLYKAENNIAIGAAYLHVIHYKYMRKVKDETSRMYCAIAAYNTGTTNVAKAFIKRSSFQAAVTEINKLESDEVYERLKNYLPYKETRNYIIKVSRRMEKYQ